MPNMVIKIKKWTSINSKKFDSQYITIVIDLFNRNQRNNIIIAIIVVIYRFISGSSD
jgi:hypothetical protein